MGCVVEMSLGGFWKRWRHKLFHCRTFWRLRPFYHCSKCGRGMRCYWDGNDIEGHGINICNRCARKIEMARQNTKVKKITPPNNRSDEIALLEECKKAIRTAVESEDGLDGGIADDLITRIDCCIEQLRAVR